MNKVKNKIRPFICCVFAAALLQFSFFKLDVFSQTEKTSESSQNFSRNLHQWGAINLFSGLPSDRVHAIAQDANGVLWFGTERGLARYDGRRVQTVIDENLPVGSVLSLETDNLGALWIGTETGGARFVNGEFQLIEKTVGKVISSILIAPERESVILAGNGQIFECRQIENNLEVQAIPNQPILVADSEPKQLAQITSLAISQNILLAGTNRRGLLHLEANNEVLGEVMSRPRPFFVNVLAKDTNGNLWLGAQARANESGLFIANDIYRPEKIGAGLGTVTALDFDNDGNFYIGTAERGAFHFRGRQQLENFTFENTAGGLRSNNILTVFVDRESVVWFGTDRGAFRYDPNAPRSEQISSDPQSNFVRTLFQMRTGLVFAGTNRGLFSAPEINQPWHENRNFIGKTIFGVAETDAEQLLVGTASGLFVNGVLQSASLDRKQTNDSVRAIRQFQNKIYLAIFNRGLEEVENNSRTIVFPVNDVDPGLREVTSLYVENDKKLWVGTARNGVFLFDGNGFFQDPALEKLKIAIVRAINGNEETGIWFATEKGLFIYQNGKLEAVLPDANARSVYLEKEQTGIWSATSTGLFHIKFNQEFGWLVSRLEVEQGLPSANIFAVLPLANGGLMIGTNRGVVRYNSNPVKPLLIPTRILSQKLHAPEELKNGINLDYPQTSLALEVTAISSRTFPEQFQYAFLLRDGSGVVVRKKISNDAQFLMENLKPGNYQVEALAFNQDLLSSEPLIFNFSIAKSPFPWTSVSLGVLLALALVALCWAVIERRRIARAGRQLTAVNRELVTARFDLANEAERTSRRIARDLHDQTLADLRHLLMLTDKIDDGVNEQAAIIRSEIETVSSEIRRICEDLSPSVLENIGFAAALEWALQQSAATGKFSYEFHADEDFEDNLKLPPNVQIQIYRIAQEVIQNISRHAKASHLRAAVINTPDFVLTIEDDGREFEPPIHAKGRGLANIRARASLIEAEISWAGRLDGGTIFTLRKFISVDSHTV
ncbi:MAG: two-component regulator propeller domain-containing protein [Pyrinomonadaceae bacterium]